MHCILHYIWIINKKKMTSVTIRVDEQLKKNIDFM